MAIRRARHLPAAAALGGVLALAMSEPAASGPTADETATATAPRSSHAA